MASHTPSGRISATGRGALVSGPGWIDCFFWDGRETVSAFAACEFVDSETPLATLVELAQAGDREALGEIVHRYERTVYATALRRMGSDSDAREVAQEVFMQLVRKIGQLREPEALGSWLRSITHRLALNRLARGGQELVSEPEALESHCATVKTPLATALEHERATQVREGLSRLRPLDRATLEAFYVEGQSLVEMASAFASPVGTIKRRLHVARRRLAEELEIVMNAE
jgi:RNA polymerase sigma-70 factor (ECF subfamily)